MEAERAAQSVSATLISLKIELPDGTTKNFQVPERSTADSAKATVFKQSDCLTFEDPERFLFLIIPTEDDTESTDDIIDVEFVKLLSRGKLRKLHEENKFINLKLITRQTSVTIRKKLNPRSIHTATPFKSHTNLDQFEKLLGAPREPTPEVRDKPRKRSSKSTSGSLTGPITRRNRSATTSNPGRFKNFLGSIGNNSHMTASRNRTDPEVSQDSDSETSETKEEIVETVDWADETESSLIAPKQFAFHTEVGDRAMQKLNFVPENFKLEVPAQINYFEIFFTKRDHTHFIGNDEKLGPVFISLVEDKTLSATRCLIRVPAETELLLETCSGKFTGTPLKNFLAKSKFNINRKNLKKIRNSKLSKEANKFDESHLVRNYKFGVLYCKEGQSTENEWFGNEHGSDEFNDFLDIIGERITLKGWDKFRGGLDVNEGSTGQESMYLEYKSHQIMYHVSTLLPYNVADEQKIERKRHIGNDIVVIIFIEGDFVFTPEICKSVFNHTYICVKKHPEIEDSYLVGVTIKDGVKPYGPRFPFPPIVHKDTLRMFLVHKMLNAEWAAYRSLEFSHKFKRTRKMQLSSILKDFENE